MSSDTKDSRKPNDQLERPSAKARVNARNTAAKVGVMFAALLLGGFSVSVITNSYLLDALYSSPALLSLLGAIVSLTYYVYLVSLKTDRSDLINAERSVYVDPSIVSGRDIHVNYVGLSEEVLAKKASQNTESTSPPSAALEAKPHLHTPFESYVNAIVKALDDRISLSEIKASLLLTQGKSLMGWGVFFYISAIIFWQILSHYWGYSYVILVGMLSSSLLFVVIEFLAAWFLKQYRGYIDSSMTYLQTRSIYNNYLLTYYALNQFDENLDTKEALVKMLGEKIVWPSIKEVSKNDFNYMVESVGAFSLTMDKLKSTLQSAKKKSTAKKDRDKADSA